MTRRWTRRRRSRHEDLERVRAGYDAALVDAGTVLFQQVSRDVDAHHVSSSVASLLGRAAADFLAPGALRDLVHPDDLDVFRTVVPVGPVLLPEPPPTPGGDVSFDLPPAEAPAPVAIEPIVRLRTADGDWCPVLVRRAPAPPDAPVRGALIDLRVGAAERSRSDRFADMVERSLDAMLLLVLPDRSDPATLSIRSANASARRLFRLDERLGRHGGPTDMPLDAVFADASERLLRSALFDVAHTGRSLTASRLTFEEVPGTHLDMRIDRLRDGTLGVTFVDVTRTVAAEQRLHHEATHDALTGLADRRLFEERLTAALLDSVATDPSPVPGIVVAELDGLREVNESHGQRAGDHLLLEVAGRLADACDEGDLVARLGGASFGVVIAPAATREELLERVETIRRVLDEPLQVEGHLFTSACTVGHAVAPADGDDARALVRSAEARLQRARADSLPVLAAPGPVEGPGLLEELRRGLADNDLELRFQPMVELRTGRVTKVEALLRWQREEDGARVPAELLELAERSGLIQPLTRWMLGEAGRAATLLARPGDTTVVTANLSLRNLGRTELLSFLELLVGSGELDPALVEVELPEGEISEDPTAAREAIARMRSLGLRVVVDELGSSYTSVSTLADLDVDGVKIDRSFVTTLASVPSDVAVVRSTVHLAHQLGLEVTAEGVTDAASLAVLADVGCDHAQGSHICAPVTLDELPDRVAELESALAGWQAATASPVA